MGGIETYFASEGEGRQGNVIALDAVKQSCALGEDTGYDPCLAPEAIADARASGLRRGSVVLKMRGKKSMLMVIVNICRVICLPLYPGGFLPSLARVVCMRDWRRRRRRREFTQRS